MKLEEAINGLKCGAVNEEYNVVSFNKAWLDKAYDTLKQFIEGDCEEDVKEAIKRLRQETCPATYMPDFDKEECLQVIEQALQRAKANKNYIESLEVDKRALLDILSKRSKDKSLAERCWEIVKEYLDFKYAGITKDYVNDTKATKFIIKIESKNTGATIHIHLNTKAEFETLQEGLK